MQDTDGNTVKEELRLIKSGWNSQMARLYICNSKAYETRITKND